MVCLWAATKALEGDKQVIKMIHDAFFSVFEDKRRDELKEMFSQRYKRYNEAWDESSGGMQLVLAANILSEMFNEGEFNESLLDMDANLAVLDFVFITMENVLDARGKIRLTSMQEPRQR